MARTKKKNDRVEKDGVGVGEIILEAGSDIPMLSNVFIGSDGRVYAMTYCDPNEKEVATAGESFVVGDLIVFFGPGHRMMRKY